MDFSPLTSMTIQFSGESSWDAIVNHESLNIEEEQSFEEFVVDQGRDKNASLDELEKLYSLFQAIE